MERHTAEFGPCFHEFTNAGISMDQESLEGFVVLRQSRNVLLFPSFKRNYLSRLGEG